MIKETIIKLSKKQDLAYAEAEAVMDEIMSGQATPVPVSYTHLIHTKIYKISFYYCHNPQNPL